MQLVFVMIHSYQKKCSFAIKQQSLTIKSN